LKIVIYFRGLQGGKSPSEVVSTAAPQEMI